MSAPGFTKGPWTAEVQELSEGFSGIVYAANGLRVGTDHLSEADAHLIAAAPDLYGAVTAHLAARDKLEHESVYSKNFENNLGGIDETLAQMRAALAKARGEQP